MACKTWKSPQNVKKKLPSVSVKRKLHGDICCYYLVYLKVLPGKYAVSPNISSIRNN